MGRIIGFQLKAWEALKNVMYNGSAWGKVLNLYVPMIQLSVCHVLALEGVLDIK